MTPGGSEGNRIRTELEAGVLTITLADPDNRNALSRALSTELVTAMGRVENDDRVRVVVLTNEGSVFCAGADLSERSAPPPGGERRHPHDTDLRITGESAREWMQLAQAFAGPPTDIPEPGSRP